MEDHFDLLKQKSDYKAQRSDQYNQKIRSEILDKGNTQARNVDAELAQYDVKWLKYSIKIPVITKEEED